MSDDPLSRAAATAGLVVGAYIAWRRGLLASLPFIPPPSSDHADPSATDGLPFIPLPLPGATPMPTPIAAQPRPQGAPRGIYNHNPGNIERTAETWRGQSQVQADDRFVQFDAPIWGLRALAKLLRNYQTRYGLRTIRTIIGRWAPQGENNTVAYVDAVAEEVHQAPDAFLDLVAHPEILHALMAAIVHHENGQQPYPDSLFVDAIALAA